MGVRSDAARARLFVGYMTAWVLVTRGVTAHEATNGGVQLWLRTSRT
jgi:hypothetical protein